ncbi:MAG: class I adenylate-forming enzyme family protein [Roseovarius pacificus]|nr:class I adenylate-forming enzyme family protein [Roseovarius pacificus]
MYPIHFFDRAARLWPDHIAVEHGDEALSYKALHDRVQALAKGLQTLDPAFGSRVGICCYNSVDHLISWLAVLAAGKVWVPLQPMNSQGRTCARGRIHRGQHRHRPARDHGQAGRCRDPVSDVRSGGRPRNHDCAV